MAYLTLIASVAEEQIDALRLDSTVVLFPTMIKGVSHLLSYWIKEQPLGYLLGTAIDGGEQLSPDLWHPLRPPMVHRPTFVARLADDLSAAWTSVQQSSTFEDEWLAFEMQRLLTVMDHAAQTNECLVTALDAPGDLDRAQYVRIPWVQGPVPPFPNSSWDWWKRLLFRWP